MIIKPPTILEKSHIIVIIHLNIKASSDNIQDAFDWNWYNIYFIWGNINRFLKY